MALQLLVDHEQIHLLWLLFQGQPLTLQQRNPAEQQSLPITPEALLTPGMGVLCVNILVIDLENQKIDPLRGG